MKKYLDNIDDFCIETDKYVLCQAYFGFSVKKLKDRWLIQ